MKEKTEYDIGLRWSDSYVESYKNRLLTMDELINTLSIRIYDMGAQWLKTPDWSGQTTLDSFCRIFYTENGTAWVTCDGERIEFLPGRFYFFPAHTKMFFPENHDTFLYLLHCRINVLSGIDLWHLLLPHAVELATPEPELAAEFKRFALNPPCDMNGQLDLLVLTYRLVALFFREGNFSLPNYSDAMVKRISKAVSLLEKEPLRSFRIAELARLCGRSRARFSTEFKMVTGMAPARYQMIFRLNCIQQQLLRSDAKLQALARDFGFSSAYHLSSAFKHYFGVSPAAFRKNMKQRGILWNSPLGKTLEEQK